MKLESPIIKANIQNLTSLWQEAGRAYQSYYSFSGFDYCLIQNSDWPNRLWFNEPLDKEKMDLAFQKVLSKSPGLILPHWYTKEQGVSPWLDTYGFSLLFNQIGMSLELGIKFQRTGNLVMKRASSKPECQAWSDLFKAAFGYRINPDILGKIGHTVRFYLAYHDDMPIGTGIIHNSKDIAGIHGVGVIPEARGNGYARQIMEALINEAIDDGSALATLQASDMGKNLYLKMGFKEEFMIGNYAL